MTKEEKTSRRPNFFKKTSVLITLIGVIIAAIAGGYQIFQEVSHIREIQKEVKIQLSIGDSFFERFEHERAIEEYEKALELDKDNVETSCRIITAKREKLQYYYYNYYDDTKQEEVDDTLAMIYRLRALDPSLNDDIELLLEEALILEANMKPSDSIMILEKAHKISPVNPDVLAKLGHMRVMASSNEDTEGFHLIHRAIEIQPNEPRYHYYLGEALEEACFHAEAIREYNRTIKFAVGQDIRSERLRNSAFEKVMDIFHDHYLDEDKLLTAEFDMPLEERVQVLEYCSGTLEPESGWSGDPYLYLARTYYELGNLKKTVSTLQAGLPEDKSEWNEELSKAIALAMILEETGFDTSTLGEINDMINNTYIITYSSGNFDMWPKARDYFDEMKKRQEIG